MYWDSACTLQKKLLQNTPDFAPVEFFRSRFSQDSSTNLNISPKSLI